MGTYGGAPYIAAVPGSRECETGVSDGFNLLRPSVVTFSHDLGPTPPKLRIFQLSTIVWGPCLLTQEPMRDSGYQSYQVVKEYVLVSCVK